VKGVYNIILPYYLLAFLGVCAMFAQGTEETWLILNKDQKYASGVHVPCRLKVDKSIIQGPYDYGNYEIQTNGRIYAHDFLIASGGLHVGGTADPGTDNLIVDGKIAIGKTTPWAELDVDGEIRCDKFVIGHSGISGSWDIHTRGSVHIGDELEVEDNITVLGGLHVGSSWDPGSDNLVVDGKVGIGTNSPYEKLHVDGEIYVAYMDGTSSGSPVRWCNNRLCRETSSLRFKNDVKPLIEDFQKIMQVEPSIYTDKFSGNKEIGYIAETFDSLGLGYLVVYHDNKPDGIKYERISLYLLEILKDQNNVLLELQAQNKLLQERVAALENSISDHTTNQ
jgi:hypothetical protein